MNRCFNPLQLCLSRFTGIWIAVAFGINSVSAVSPGSILMGKQLFEKQWTPANPSLTGKDGLGPLFNANSCLRCHHVGGVGGSGGAEFNASTLAIESMRIVSRRRIDQNTLVRAVGGFHPGFIDSDGGMINTMALPHHGGSSAFDVAREYTLTSIPAYFSERGGSESSEEVRLATTTPILYSNRFDGVETTIQAKLFQRNTPALYGAGLIDQVTSKQLRRVEREQKSHPEISGRLATLSDGRMGRFGWRGHVPTLLDFCDKACAAELGLETRRLTQPSDPMVPHYSNPTHDISDQQIRAIADFIAALPAPSRQAPTDPDQLQRVIHGEQLFESVGCSVCHRPTLGEIKGIYSDLLLHDMGEKNYDLSPADPYIVDAQGLTETQSSPGNSQTANVFSGGNSSYSGGSAPINITQTINDVGDPSGISSSDRMFSFQAPRGNSQKIRFVPLGTKTERVVGKESGVSTRRVSRSIRLKLKPTMTTQEWRTPPLWGVADSAPYMHDGRAETLLEAITMHDGESKGTRDRFLRLSYEQRNALLAFLGTLVSPPTAPQPEI